jgi:hypothetical protein
MKLESKSSSFEDFVFASFAPLRFKRFYTFRQSGGLFFSRHHQPTG